LNYATSPTSFFGANANAWLADRDIQGWAIRLPMANFSRKNLRTN
jgi:hypothetical protein